MGGRGFGVAMESLCNYLGSEYGNTFALGVCDKHRGSSDFLQMSLPLGYFCHHKCLDNALHAVDFFVHNCS